MHSLKDELAFLLSGKGMPYEKISILVAIVVSLIFCTFMSSTYIKEGKVAVIDLDNSSCTHEFIDKINASPYIKVDAVLNVPADPKKLLYQDRYLAVIYLPVGFEKSRYGDGEYSSIGVFYDNTNAANSAGIRTGLSTIIAIENHEIGAPRIEELGLSSEQAMAAMSNISLKERIMFNPTGSFVNTIAMTMVLFFTSMFFCFATLGIPARLRLEGKWTTHLMDGTPFDLMMLLVPYAICLTVSTILALGILKFVGDLNFAGNFFVLLLALMLHAMSLGLLCMLAGWSAAHPGAAVSRMPLFLPAGLVLGGGTLPLGIVPNWVLIGSNVFPLVWVNRLARDVILRGASFWDAAQEFGGFMIYISVIVVLLCLLFYRDQQKLYRNNNTSVARNDTTPKVL